MSDYQGWTNYETWNCNLWIENDPGLIEMIEEQIDDPDIDPADIADFIKDFVEDNNPLNDTADLYTDLLNTAISKIDFDEIAEAMIENKFR